jgi:hypothetical protein
MMEIASIDFWLKKYFKKSRDSKFFRENEQTIRYFSRMIEDLIKFIMKFNFSLI